MPSSSAWLGKCSFVGAAAVQRHSNADAVASTVDYRSKQCILQESSPFRALKKSLCLPTTNWSLCLLFSPALREFHSLLVPTRGTGPPSGPWDMPKGQLVSRAYGYSLLLWNRSKMAFRTDPETLASLVLCCLLGRPPGPPNA